MLGLLIKLLGDSSGFSKEVDKTKKKAAEGGQNVGKAFGEQFKAAMMSYLGAGAILGAFRKAMQESVKIESGALKLNIDPEAFQELSKAAELLGMSVEELQQVAPTAAKEFEALMTSIRSGGGILDSKTVELFADTADSMDRLWAQMQPALGFFVKSASWLIGQGQRVSETYAGLGMAAYGSVKRMLTGNDDIQRAGVELVRDAANTKVDWGASPIASERRQRSREMRSALDSNRRLQAAKAASISEAFANGVGNLGSTPLLGGVFSEMTKAMQATAESTQRTAAAIEKKL